MTSLRGTVLWADLGTTVGSEQSGRRPVVVVSREAVNRTSTVVIVVPFTTWRSQRLYPSDVFVESGVAGLAEDSVAVALQVRVLSKLRLGKVLGQLDPATLARVEEALAQVLDLPRD